MADKQVIIGIKIEGTQQALNDMARLNAEIEQSKKLTKELSETDKTAAEQQKIITKQKVEAYNQIAKETKATVEAGNAEIKTLATMRAELGRLNKVAENAKFGSDAFKKAQEEATKLRKEINNADQAAGKFQGNVGNYKGAIIDAFQSMGINVSKYTGLISTATTVTSAFSTSTTAATGAAGGFTVALRVMALAIASTGIGAIIVLLGILTAAFASTKEGQELYEEQTIKLGTTVRSLGRDIQNLSVALYEGNAKKIKQSGILVGLWISQFGAMAQVATNLGSSIYKKTERLDDIRLKLAQTEASINLQLAEQKELYTTSTDRAERNAAAEKYLKLNKEITDLKIEEAQLIYDIANSTSVTSRNDAEQLDIALKLSAVEQVKATALNETLKTKKFLANLDKKSLAEQEAAAKEALKAEEERRKSLNLTTIEISKLATEVEKLAKAFVTDISKLPEVDAILFESIQRGIDLAKEATIEIKTEYQIRSEALDNAFDSEAISQVEHNEAMKQINAEYSVAIVDQTANMFNKLAEIAGKNSKAGKAFAAAAILMDTYVSAMSGFKQGMATGGIILAIAQAAIATAFGLKQLHQLYAVKEPNQPKYAHGVIGLQGAGSETSDSIDAKLSRGESVMTAKATRVFAPMLADMELAVGNRPNFQMGGRRFASGFIPNTNIMGNSEQIIRETIKAIGMIPVVVSETDITSTQARVRRIKVTSDL